MCCGRLNMCLLGLLLSPWVLPHNGVLLAFWTLDSMYFFPLEITLLQQLKPGGDVISVNCLFWSPALGFSWLCGNQVALDKDSGTRLSFLTGYSWELNVLKNSTLKPQGSSWELRVGQQACFLLCNGCVKIGTLPDFWCWRWWLDQSRVGDKGRKDLRKDLSNKDSIHRASFCY